MLWAHRIRIAFVGCLILLSASYAAGQLTYSRGQAIAPSFEGWEKNPDGSFDLLFGYMNSNWEQEIDIPVGASNAFSPGTADRGQPTHFLPRRNRFVFRVTVPADFGDTQLVWTLTSGGEATRAYASLKTDYFLDPITIISEKGGIAGGRRTDPELYQNQPPTLSLEGNAQFTAAIGEKIPIVMAVSDDGIPRARPFGAPRSLKSPPPQSVTVNSATGLRASCFLYRGADALTLEPPQIKTWEDTREGANSPWSPGWVTPALPADGRIVVYATFSAAGNYWLRCRADDGGLWQDQDVKIAVAGRS